MEMASAVSFLTTTVATIFYSCVKRGAYCGSGRQEVGGYEGVAQAAPLCRAVDRRHEPFVVQLLFFEWALFGLFRGVRSGLCETGEGCVWVCAKEVLQLLQIVL